MISFEIGRNATKVHGYLFAESSNVVTFNRECETSLLGC